MKYTAEDLMLCSAGGMKHVSLNLIITVAKVQDKQIISFISRLM